VDSGGRGSGLSVLHRSDFHNSGVDAAADAVLHFDVEFGDDVGFEGLVFFEIFLGGSIDDVSDVEALDGFVLGAELSAVDADDGFNVSSVVLVATVVSSLDGHVVIITQNDNSTRLKYSFIPTQTKSTQHESQT